MKINLYIDYISQPSRAVLAFCLINKIPIDIHQVRVAKLQHLTQQYKQINPMKKVPAIVDPSNGLRLGQSHAIINYLMRKHKLDQKWYKNQVQRAKIDEYLHYHHQNTRKCSGILYKQVFSKLYPVSDAASLEHFSPRQDVKKVLSFIERYYFKESDFMIGDSLSVADLAAYFQMQTLVVVSYDFSAFQNITKWMKKIENIEQIKQTNANMIKVLPKLRPKL